MQPKKKRFTLEDYIGNSKGCSYIKGCSKLTETLKCVCDKDNGDGMKCFKCGSYTHKCIEKGNNRGNKFQCASCISKALDPIFTVKKVLVQSYFETKCIFQFYNQINFQFSVTSQQLCHQIQIRGLKAGSTRLSWPMQGAFFLNDQKQTFYQLKPLQVNSSRKKRKQDYIIVPREKLRPGKNYIRFKIVVVKRAFTQKYQCQDKGIYFMSINSINVINKDNLIKETFHKRRLQPKASLDILSESLNGIQIVKQKLILTCPLTMNKIKIPVRGKYCKHFGCACLETIIKFHAQSRQWSCPLCDCRINEPFIDLYVYEILKDHNSASTVYIQKDGSYQWVENPQAVELDDDEQSPPHREAYSQEKKSISVMVQDREVEILQPQIQLFQNNEQRINQEQIVQIIEPQDLLQVQAQQNQRKHQRYQAQLIQKANTSAQNGAQKKRKEITDKLIESIKLQIMKMAIDKREKQRQNEIIEKRDNILFNNNNTQACSSANQNQGQPIRAQQTKKNKIRAILSDIPELRSKQQSRQFFKKQNMQGVILQEKAIANFLKKHSDFKSLFNEAIV